MDPEITELVIALSRADHWLPGAALQRALVLGLIDHIAIRREEISDPDSDRTVTSCSLVLRTQAAPTAGE